MGYVGFTPWTISFSLIREEEVGDLVKRVVGRIAEQ